jgi:hypothetical protein
MVEPNIVRFRRCTASFAVHGPEYGVRPEKVRVISFKSAGLKSIFRLAVTNSLLSMTRVLVGSSVDSKVDKWFKEA